MEGLFRWEAPEPAAGALVRQRLLAPLARRFEVRLVAIEAGAGFGKTTLLAQALSENRLRSAGSDAWLSCELADASPSNLLAALLRALHVASDPDEPATVDSVCEAVWSRAPTQVCLVLDDVHRLDTTSDGWDALVALIDQLPANGHVVLAGRGLGALPLRQLLVKGVAVSLGEDDLRLDDDELQAVAETRQVAPDVLADTAGWPALAELRVSAGGAADDNALLKELLGTLSPAARRQFAAVVAVGGGDADTLTAALGEAPEVETLAALPLVRRNAGGGLQPHALWQRVLEAELPPDAIRDVRRRAADACTARGDNRRAFELLAAVGDWDAALPVLFDACHDQLSPPWPDTLARWRSLVPADRTDRPEVVYLDGLIVRADDPWSPRAADAFQRVVEQFRAAGDVSREIQAISRAGWGRWLAGDRGLVADNMSRLAEMGAPVVPILDAMTRFNKAIQGDLDLDPETVLSALDVEIELEPRLDFFFPLLRGWAQLVAGDGPAARAEAASALEKAARSRGAAGTQLCSLLDPVAAWMSGALDAADSLGDPGPRWSIAERVPTLAVAAIVAAHRARDAEARDLLRQARALVPDVGDRHFLAGFLAVAEATLLVAAGDDAAAGAVIDALMGRTPFEGATTGRALVWLGAVPSLVSDAAATFVGELPLGPSRRRALEAIEALRHVRAGEPPGAVALLDDARALLTVLPLPLATELACGAAACSNPRGSAVVQTLRSIAPRETREALQRVAASASPRVRQAGAALLSEVPIPPPEPVRVEVFGPAQILRNGEVVTDRNWRRERVRQLLLLLVDRRAIRRAEVADLLWPDLDADAVAANLRTTLRYLHGILEPHRRQGEAPYILRQDSGVLRLADDESFTVDAWELEHFLDRAAATERDGLASVSLSLLLDALALWRGPYLEDVATEPWAEPTRRRMHDRVTAAGIRASELLVAAGRAHDAPGPARTALEADPWSEAAYRALIGAHLALGERAVAKRALAACRDMLDDLGVEPDPATAALAAEVGRPGSRSAHGSRSRSDR